MASVQPELTMLSWLVVGLAVPLIGQAQAPLSGIITDSAGAPLSGVSVAVKGTPLAATTDESGRFRLSGIALGPVELTVRRLGFVPIARMLDVSSHQSIEGIELRMAAAPRMLSSVVVESDYPEYTGRLAGYYQRLERRSSGYFISRDEIDRKSYRALSQLLRTVPGIHSVGLRSGGNGIRMRGRGCRPLVWIDGVAMPAGEVDLDAFPTSTLHGIELYSGATAVPSDFIANGGLSSCGTILLWSRGPDTEAPARPRESTVNLQRLIESLTLFTADQVEKAAVMVEPEAFDLKYPPELFSEGVAGYVLAEFVVDTAGTVEGETVTMVSSTHPLFFTAVLRSLRSARYAPAVKHGRPVRQVVQQPFRFEPRSRKSSRVGR